MDKFFLLQDLVAYAKAVDVVLHTHGDQPGMSIILKYDFFFFLFI